jgi:cytochrome c-type biogenesis protein CcmH
MGWIFPLGFAGLAFLALVLSRRCSRMALELSGAILLVAVAGYGWQGSPDMAGHPVTHVVR